MEKFYITNEMGTFLAVLVSAGFGAGWSTEGEQGLAVDSRLIDFLLSRIKYDSSKINEHTRIKVGEIAKSKEFKELVLSLYPETYLNSVRHLYINFVPKGVFFQINEYDGFESINIFSPNDYFLA